VRGPRVALENERLTRDSSGYERLGEGVRFDDPVPAAAAAHDDRRSEAFVVSAGSAFDAAERGARKRTFAHATAQDHERVEHAVTIA
jgi:hypothetical protein